MSNLQTSENCSPDKEGVSQAEWLPNHLKRYVVEQQPSAYTPLDHAIWRSIMRVNEAFFRENAHPLYREGLAKTGIPIEHIPHIADMNTCLSRFGWRAVAVSGFIPPNMFMEFQARGILPIACDMRRPAHLTYTPAPDIVHEAAGHAPMLADPDYAAYLKNYGDVARKAISASHDDAMFWVIRRLSEVKESSTSTPAEVKDVESQLEAARQRVTYTSESAELARFYWWTVEYGLFGTIDKPKIYGAGLLSSVGESQSCMQPDVEKHPFSLDCIQMGYDITRPQPQLYVTPDFKSLSQAIETFAKTMAFRTGGMSGLNKALAAQTVNTVEFDSGLQISGVLTNVIQCTENEPAYLQFTGPCQLAVDETELDRHSTLAHPQGFGAPVGLLTDGTNLANATQVELSALGIQPGVSTTLHYQSGVQVTGSVKQIQQHLIKHQKTILIIFLDCTVTYKDQTLFEPSWGVYDLACGTEVTSVFGGPADRVAYPDPWDNQDIPQQKSNFEPDEIPLYQLMQSIRDLRESSVLPNADALETLYEASESLNNHPMVWVAWIELLELTHTLPNGDAAPLQLMLQNAIEKHQKHYPQWTNSIEQNVGLLKYTQGKIKSRKSDSKL